MRKDIVEMALKPITNEADILSRIALGDQRSFVYLVNAYYAPLGEPIFRLLESKELTEEVLQDVFLTIWQRRHTLPAIHSFVDYLYILTRNRALRYLKITIKERSQKQEWSNASQHDISCVQDNTTHEDYYLDLLEDIVNKLPPKQKQAYQLCKYEGMKYEEAALKMGVSVETIRKHMHLSLAFIKENLRSKKNAAAFSFILGLTALI